MCNLYNLNANQAQIADIARAYDRYRNLPPDYSVFPDYPAPIVRVTEGRREIASARWGMPTPPTYLEGKKVDKGVTNVRNLASPHWRRWQAPEYRCVVPWTSFSEYSKTERDEKGRLALKWFAINGERPLAWFAGIWTEWTSVRKLKEGTITTDVFAFLTTAPNAVVKPIHVDCSPP